MSSPRYLILLLTLTGIYFVRMKWPALAYLAIPLSMIMIAAHPRRFYFSIWQTIFLLSILYLIAIIGISGDISDRGTLAFMVNLLLSALVFVSLSQKLNSLEAKNTLRTVIKIFFLLATFDTSYKFIFPQEFSDEVVQNRDFWEFGLYAYKGSFFYQDSNALAFFILPVIYLITKPAVIFEKKSVNRFFIIYAFALMFLTFSRAGYVATLIILAFNSKYKKLRLLIAPALIAVAYYAFTIIENDLSLAYKFIEAQALLTHMMNSDTFQLLFGRGFGWGDSNLFFIQGSVVKTSIEIGLIGCFFYIILLISLAIHTNSKLFILGLFVFSQSSNFYWLPAFVVGLIMLDKNIERVPEIRTGR